MRVLAGRIAGSVFLVFAVANFLSSLIRSITVTWSPVLTQEFALLGTPQALAFKLVFAVFLICCIASCVHFRRAAGHNHAP